MKRQGQGGDRKDNRYWVGSPERERLKCYCVHFVTALGKKIAMFLAGVASKPVESMPLFANLVERKAVGQSRQSWQSGYGIHAIRYWSGLG